MGNDSRGIFTKQVRARKNRDVKFRDAWSQTDFREILDWIDYNFRRVAGTPKI